MHSFDISNCEQQKKKTTVSLYNNKNNFITISKILINVKMQVNMKDPLNIAGGD